MGNINTLSKEFLPENELKVGTIYRVQFLNGFKMLVQFAGFQGSRYYFFTEGGGEFSIADSSIQYLHFHQA